MDSVRAADLERYDDAGIKIVLEKSAVFAHCEVSAGESVAPTSKNGMLVVSRLMPYAIVKLSNPEES